MWKSRQKIISYTLPLTKTKHQDFLQSMQYDHFALLLLLCTCSPASCFIFHLQHSHWFPDNPLASGELNCEIKASRSLISYILLHAAWRNFQFGFFVHRQALRTLQKGAMWTFNEQWRCWVSYYGLLSFNLQATFSDFLVLANKAQCTMYTSTLWIRSIMKLQMQVQRWFS